VAYRSNLDTRDKGGAIAAVVAIHVALLFALLNLSGNMDLPGGQAVLRVFNLANPPPPPPPPPPVQRQQPRPKK
jgi:protein TonB